MAASLTAPTRNSVSTNGHRPASSSSGGPRRNRARIGAGVLVIVLSVLAAVTLYSSAGHRTSVLIVRRAVPAGRPIVAGDLGTASVSMGSGVSAIPSGQLDHVVGQVPRVNLVPGSLLNPSELSSGVLVPHGDALAGATLKPGQYPPDLAEGDRVDLVKLPGATDGQPDSSQPLRLGEAEVLRLVPPSQDTDTATASLLVDARLATAVGAAGAEGQLSLVVINP